MKKVFFALMCTASLALIMACGGNKGNDAKPTNIIPFFKLYGNNCFMYNSFMSLYCDIDIMYAFCQILSCIRNLPTIRLA